MRGPSVRWRSGGYQLDPDSDVLRFEVADLNRVITGSVANAELYRPLQDDRAHPADWQVLTLSCSAVTPEWTPRRLAVDTGFRSYRLGRAATLAWGATTCGPPRSSSMTYRTRATRSTTT